MAGKKIEDQSVEELRNNRKKLLSIAYVTLGILLLYLLFLIYMIFSDAWEIEPLHFIILFVFASGVFPSVFLLAAINKELKKRY